MSSRASCPTRLVCSSANSDRNQRKVSPVRCPEDVAPRPLRANRRFSMMSGFGDLTTTGRSKTARGIGASGHGCSISPDELSRNTEPQLGTVVADLAAVVAGSRWRP